MMPFSTKEWTADELLHEARRRERAAASPDRTRSGMSTSGRARDLSQVPTGELVRGARDHQRVIYGTDNRKDIYQITSQAARRSADAVVALVKSPDLTENADGSFSLSTETFQSSYGLCGSEPFVSQPLGCFCSGFLIAPDVIATAGHCVKSQADLKTMRFVFGFRMTNATTAVTTFPAADVFAGKTLLGRALAQDGTDYALVQLDRTVVNRTPVAVRRTGKIKDNQALYVIGHPCGLPQKYADGAKVRENTSVPFFVANLDTYGGNSGSPVFNAQNHTVEGILVRGETDFVSNGQCSVSLVCPSTGCRGEDVTRAPIWIGNVPKPAAAGAGGGKRKAAARARRKSVAKTARSRTRNGGKK
jgi:V8-like Glu-specific endopeptidase